MLKHVLFLFFLYGIKNGSSSPQEKAVESKDVFKNGIKKNEVGANGLEANWEKVTRNFQNPVLEYLLRNNAERTMGPPERGVVREIRHSQTLLLPNLLGAPLAGVALNQLPQIQSQIKLAGGGTGNSNDSPFDNFWNFLRNKTQPGGSKLQESIVSSPVLHLNKTTDGVQEDSRRIEMYPAVAVVINTFGKDGSLKSSVTHFQPDFNSFGHETYGKEATYISGGRNSNKNHKLPNSSQYTVSNYIKGSQSQFPVGVSPVQESRQGISWPFANYFPVAVNDPFLSVYNTFSPSMYNAVSSMVEYGAEARDDCAKEKGRRDESENRDVADQREVLRGYSNENKVPAPLDRYRESTEMTDSNIFDEVTMRSDSFKRINRKPLRTESEDSNIGRQRRDATSIYVKSREGDTVDITLEEPTGSNANQRISKGSNLILRKGGVAIAGPGGAATAYTGGTAIVGPYGTVYKSPAGTAILGPFSKVVDITDDTSFEEILRMHKEMQSQNKEPTFANPSQPGVGFRNYQNFFSYKTNLPVKFEVKPKGRSFVKIRPSIVRLKEEGIASAIEEIKKAEFRRLVQDTPYEQRMAKNNETTLIFRPKSKAEAGRNGVALSAPTSHAILYPGQKARIYFEPESVASAGPSGFAHAHSDLFVTYVADNTTVVPQEARRKRSLKAIFLKKP